MIRQPSLHDPTTSRHDRSMPALRVVCFDDALVVVDKPAGELSVPGRGEDKQGCSWQRVRSVFADALVVHRLDQATSGLLLFARGADLQRRLSHAFATRQVHKGYVAVVTGLVQADNGCIELPLSAHWLERPRQHVDLHSGKPALTSWQVLQRDAALQRTRLALQPLTGRTHQLRVHLAAIGHAIVGDALYAPASIAPDGRMLLHASELELEHPLEQRRLHVCSDAPF